MSPIVKDCIASTLHPESPEYWLLLSPFMFDRDIKLTSSFYILHVKWESNPISWNSFFKKNWLVYVFVLHIVIVCSDSQSLVFIVCISAYTHKDTCILLAMGYSSFSLLECNVLNPELASFWLHAVSSLPAPSSPPLGFSTLTGYTGWVILPSFPGAQCSSAETLVMLQQERPQTDQTVVQWV